MRGERERLLADEPTAFDDAVRIVREHVRPLEIEEVGLDAAQGRLLAERIVAREPVPPFDNSTVDGYAVRSADVKGASPASPIELTVVAEVMAGEARTPELGPGRAVRIMTGAPIPAGADAVVMLEWTEWTESRVRVARGVEPGRFIRRTGEDTAPGDVVFEAGRELGSADLGVLASLGVAVLPVRRRPLVAILVTGDELVAAHERLSPGKIRSSNNHSLAGQVREAGGVVLSLGVGRDDVRELAERIAHAPEADVLLTSGGVSVGDKDEIQRALLTLGFQKILWRVAASPGKPLLFGKLSRTLVFGLPGNPVSSMISFENFVRPVLRLLQGDPHPDRPRVHAVALEDISGPGARRHFARVRLSYGPSGYFVREVKPHGSGNLRSMVNANALGIIPESRGKVSRGETIEVIVLGRPDETAS
jgi:molybdopterin molybdotransferase